MNKTIFHVGFPKSGSTFLQRNVFPSLSNYSYMGLNTFENGSDEHSFINQFLVNIFKTDGLNFNLKKAVEDKDKIIEKCAEKSPLFSYEYGMGVLFGYPDAVTKAERLFKIYQSNIKIIIIVREQTSILKSQYRDHPFEPHDIHRGKPISFEKWYHQTKALRFFRFTDLLYYDRIAKIYDELFGQENVLILPLELMTADPDLFANRMADFLYVDMQEIRDNLGQPAENKGFSRAHNQLRRIRRIIYIPISFSKLMPDALYRTLRGFIDKGKREAVQIPDQLTEEIKARYAESNRKLEARININLEKLGYGA